MLEVVEKYANLKILTAHRKVSLICSMIIHLEITILKNSFFGLIGIQLEPKQSKRKLSKHSSNWLNVEFHYVCMGNHS